MLGNAIRRNTPNREIRAGRKQVGTQGCVGDGTEQGFLWEARLRVPVATLPAPWVYCVPSAHTRTPNAHAREDTSYNRTLRIE